MNNQEKLIAKFKSLHQVLGHVTPQPPKATDITSLRRWYRDEVFQNNQQAEAITCVKELVETDEEFSSLGAVLERIEASHSRQRSCLNDTASKLGLTPPEWD